MRFNFVVFTVAAILSTLVACDPAPRHQAGSETSFHDSGPPGSSMPEAKASYQKTCENDLAVASTASEKEFKSVEEALSGQDAAFALESVRVFEVDLEKNDQTTFLAGSAQGSDAKLTCHNTADTGTEVHGDKTVSRDPSIDATVIIPNEIAKDGKVAHVAIFDLHALKGHGVAQINVQDAKEADSTLKAFDTRIASSDDKTQRKALVVTDTDGRLHIRTQETFVAENGAKAVQVWEAVYTRK